MAVHSQALELVDSARVSMGLSWKEIMMAELGNQILPESPLRTAKKYFQSLGVFHVSIDLNGNDGAEKLDLSKPLLQFRPEWDGIFNIVTNFGTSEHIERGQWQTFRNMHDLCKDGGVMIHMVPLTGNWHKHSHYYYTKQFFTELTAACGYTMLYNMIAEYPTRKKQAQVCAILKKNSETAFCLPDNFPEVCNE